MKNLFSHAPYSVHSAKKSIRKNAFPSGASFRAVKKALLLLLLFAASLFAEDTAGLSAPGRMRTADEGFAAEEFRRGVQAYYRGAFNEAILQFERSL